MFPAESFYCANEVTDDLLRLADINKGVLLDLCCRPGRHSVSFAKKGFQETEVDLQPILLKKVGTYAHQERVILITNLQKGL